jgi:uncharacterized protein YdhG (YjbR/CyaY superfamily)
MKSAADHDAYLAALPAGQRAILQALRRQVRAELPEALEVISYAMPGFRMPGKRARVVGGYAGWKTHMAWYPHSGNVLPAIADALRGYDWDAGTLRFTEANPPSDDLVRLLLRTRLDQIG